MIEAHLKVQRTARYFAIWQEQNEPVPWDLWIVLHGYRQSARRFLGRFATMAGPQVRIVAPEGLSRFYVDEDGGGHTPEHRVGASWMTREDRENEIRDYVGYLDSLVEGLSTGEDAAPARVFVLGFSQGSHTAVRWVTLGGVKPQGLVLWGGGLPHDVDQEKGLPILRMLGVTLVSGRSDPLIPRVAVESEMGRLADLGIPSRLLEHEGGHEIEPGVLPTLATGPIIRSPTG